MQILKKYVLPLLSSFALVLLVDAFTNAATEKYLFSNFYGGWSNIINTATIWRYVEVLSYAFIGNYIVHLTTNSNDTLGRAVNKKEEIVK